MKHFKITEWTDYVRGLADADRRQAMESHLASGCKRCAELADSLARVAEVGRSESRHQAPDYAVRSIKAFFSLQRPERASGLATITLPRSFDSALAPASAGTRNFGEQGRQLLFESEDFALDVRFERPGSESSGVIVGQLLKRPAEPVANAPAYLVSDGAIAASAFTGDFGGFRLDCPAEGTLDLWLIVSDTERIAVTLEEGPAR